MELHEIRRSGFPATHRGVGKQLSKIPFRGLFKSVNRLPLSKARHQNTLSHPHFGHDVIQRPSCPSIPVLEFCALWPRQAVSLISNRLSLVDFIEMKVFLGVAAFVSVKSCRVSSDSFIHMFSSDSSRVRPLCRALQ